MTNDEQIRTPSGMGGLQSYHEPTGSKVQIKPEWIVIAIGLVVVGMAVLKLLIPIY